MCFCFLRTTRKSDVIVLIMQKEMLCMGKTGQSQDLDQCPSPQDRSSVLTPPTMYPIVILFPSTLRHRAFYWPLEISYILL